MKTILFGLAILAALALLERHRRLHRELEPGERNRRLKAILEAPAVSPEATWAETGAVRTPVVPRVGGRIGTIDKLARFKARWGREVSA